MDRVLSAEGAVLVHLQTIRIVLLILDRVVVSLLALVASQSDFNAHILTAPPYSCMQARWPVLIASLFIKQRPHSCAKSEKMRTKRKPNFTGNEILTQRVPKVNHYLQKKCHIFDILRFILR